MGSVHPRPSEAGLYLTLAMTNVLPLISPTRHQGGGMAVRAPIQSPEPDATKVLAQAAALHPGDLQSQIVFFLSNFRIGSLRGRARPVSFTTTQRYQECLSAFVNTLSELNVRPKALTEFTVKNLRMCIAHWEREGLSSSTLTNRYTVIRRLFAWAGKTPVPLLRDMLQDRDRARRTFVATEPKDWESSGVDFEALASEVESTCRYTAMQLRLERAFGLRSQEALSLRPAESDQHGVLVVTRGTKGGKGRVVPIRTQAQRDLLDRAKEMANRRTGLLQRYGLTPAQARAHYYYVLRKHGITRGDLGVTPHGLRHGYAHERYESESGEMAPILTGGAPVRSDDERKARLAVSAELGHGREEITAAYVGAVRHQPAAQQRRLASLAKTLAEPTLRASLEWMAADLKAHGYEVRLFVLGADAVGEPVARVQPMAVGVQLLAPVGLQGEGAQEPARVLPAGDAYVRVQMLTQGPLFMATKRSVVFVMLPPGGQGSERLEILF